MCVSVCCTSACGASVGIRCVLFNLRGAGEKCPVMKERHRIHMVTAAQRVRGDDEEQNALRCSRYCQKIMTSPSSCDMQMYGRL